MASRKNTIKTNIEANSDSFLKAMDEVKKSVTSARVEFKNINEIMKNSETTTSSLSAHKQLLQKEIFNTEEQLKVLNKGLEESIKLNGKDSDATRIIREEVMKASTHYESLKNELDKVNDRLDEQTFSLKSVSNAFGTVSGIADKFANKMKWVSAGAGSILGLGIKTAIDFEDAFVGVKKTIDGTDEELNQVRKDIMLLSKEIPISTTELFELAEEAGQLGIKTKDITEFTKIMSKLGTATNLSATEAGGAIATFVNVMGTLPENYERIGNVIVQLGNNSKATEADIVAMAMRMSGAASTLNMSESSVLGLATALSSVGIEAEMGGTAISRIMNDFNRAASGVETKYGTLSQYAKICGMNTKEFSEIVKKDAGTAIEKFIVGLGDANNTGEGTIKLLSELGVDEVRLTDTMLRLASASGTVEEYMSMANEEWANGNALNKEASTRYADTASQMTIAKNKVAELSEGFGKLLLPTVNDFLDTGGKLIDIINNLDDKTKKNIISVLAFTTAIAPVAKGVSKVTGTISSLTDKMNKLKGESSLAGKACAGVDTVLKGSVKTIKGLFSPTQNLITNIVKVDSRTKELTKDVKNSNTILDGFKSIITGTKNSITKFDSSLDSLPNKIKNTTKQVKDGINYWSQTTSGIDKLKSSITGIAGTVASLKGFGSSLKDISENGVNLANVSTSVASGLGSITSAAATGASIGGVYGAAIGALGTSIAVAASGVATWLNATSNVKPILENSQETFNNYKLGIDNITSSFNQSVTAITQNIDAKNLELASMQSLSTEMLNFLEVNGMVKAGCEERASVIINQLNNALGTQFSLEGGIIHNGEEIISSKERFIQITEQAAESIKKQTLLESYQAQYKEAINAQTEAKRLYNEQLSKEEQNIQDAITKMEQKKISASELEKVLKQSSENSEKAEKKYQGVLKQTDGVINGLKDVSKVYAEGSSSDLEKAIQKVTSSNKKSTEETHKVYNDTYSKASKLIKDTDEKAKKLNERFNEFKNQRPTLSVNADFSRARSETNRFANDLNRAIKGSNGVQIGPMKTIPAWAKGVVVDKPTIGLVGEAGREAVLPLENNTGWINEIANKLQNRLFNSGLNTSYITKYAESSIIESTLDKAIDLLEKILNKPSDMYLDGRKISEATAATDDIASGNILERLERGWAT